MQIIYNQIDSVSVYLDIYRNYLAFQKGKKKPLEHFESKLNLPEAAKKHYWWKWCFYRQILIKIVEKYMWKSEFFSRLHVKFRNFGKTELFQRILSQICSDLNPLSANLTKWSNTHKQFVGKLPDELFECVWPFCGIGA